MSEIWKTPDGKRRFRVPDGAELYQGPFTIIDSEEQYQMNIREEDILPFEIEAEESFEEIIGEVGKAFSELFQDLTNIFEDNDDNDEESSDESDEEYSIDENDNASTKRSKSSQSDELFDDIREGLESEIQDLVSGLKDLGKDLVEVLGTPENRQSIAELGQFLQDWAKADVEKEQDVEITEEKQEDVTSESQENAEDFREDTADIEVDGDSVETTKERIENIPEQSESVIQMYESFDIDNEEESEEDSYTMDDDFEDTVLRIVDFQDSTVPRVEESQVKESQEEESKVEESKSEESKSEEDKERPTEEDNSEKDNSEEIQQHNEQEPTQDLQSMTKKQLLELAKEKGVDCKTSWKKAKIIDALQNSK